MSVIDTESTKNIYRILKNFNCKGYKLRTKQCLSLTRLTNKIFLHTSTQCVCPSPVIRPSYPLFSIVVFRETTSSEHTISVLFLILFSRIVNESNSYFRVRIWRSVRRSWIPVNRSVPSFWRTKKSIRRKPSGFGFSGLLDFLFLSCLKIFL
jgi:hypothetical protein